MHVTNVARRATQTLSSSETTRLIEEAARRASAPGSGAASKRPRGLRRHADLIAICVASLATGTAWKNRREHEERVSILEAELAHAQTERDRAVEAVGAVRRAVVERVDEAVGVVEELGRSRGEKGVRLRADALREWVERTFESVLAERKADVEEVKPRGKPSMV